MQMDKNDYSLCFQVRYPSVSIDGVSAKHLPRYLAEFCYRFNRGFWEPQMFNRMLHACFNSDTINFAELKT